MLPVSLTSLAEVDVKDAAHWYETQVRGLGEYFLLAVDHAVAEIEENPLQFPPVHGETRRTLLRRFPYALYFRVESTRIVVVGCFHGHRSPKSWQSRK
jgi:plasmid stabilization system protein ParE